MSTIPMKICLAIATIAALASPLQAGDVPTPSELVDRMIDAAGGTKCLHGTVFAMRINEEETNAEGTTQTSRANMFVNGSNLVQRRMPMGSALVLGHDGKTGWATKGGALDDRPQTPTMAAGTLNQKSFVVLLPFSLRFPDVSANAVESTTWEGKQAWTLKVTFAKGFFVSPVLNTEWEIIVDKQNYEILAAQFLPPASFGEVLAEGMRFTYLTRQDVSGAKIAKDMLVVGIEPTSPEADQEPIFVETNHVRVVKVLIKLLETPELTLFMHPNTLQKLEDDEPI